MKMRVLSLASSMAVLGAGERPLAKVVTLLQKMQTQLQAEREEDNSVHEKHTCWCKAEDEKMSKKVQVAKATIDRSDATIKEAFAESQKKTAQKDKATVDLAKKKEDLSTQREECMSGADNYAADEHDLQQAISACGQALDVLKKHNFLQGQSKMDKPIQDALEAVANASALQTKDELLDLEAFLHPGQSTQPVQVAAPSFLQQAPGYQSYANQSGQIFGILEQMLSDLKRDQSDGAKKEAARKTACTEGISALQEEIKLTTNTISELDAALGVIADTQASAQQEFAEAKEAFGNGETYLGNLKNKCDEHNENHKSRTESREQEILAVVDTIEILHNDDAFKSFGKVAPPAPESFLQIRSLSKRQEHMNTDLRNSAAAALEKYAAKDARTFLVQYLIKSSQEVGWRAKVQSKIDELRTQLALQQTEETKERDECIAGFDATKLTTEEKTRDLSANEDESVRLADEIELLSGEIKELEESTADAKKDIQSAGEDRQKEAAEFASNIKDHQDVQAILKKAIERMNQVYTGPKGEFDFMQQEPKQHEATEIAPGSAAAELSNKGKTVQNAGGNKVTQLLQTVMNDSVQTVSELEKSENDAEGQYAEFVKQSNNIIDQNNKAVAGKTKRKGDAEKGKANADAAITANKKSLEDLGEQTAALHESCDFLVENYQARQDARANEMEALNQAKSLIEGMAE